LLQFARRDENDPSPYFAVLWPTSLATCPPGPSLGSPEALPKASTAPSGDIQGEAVAQEVVVPPELRPDDSEADAGLAEPNPPEPTPMYENGWTLEDEDGWQAECTDETDSALHSGGGFPTPELGVSFEGIDPGFGFEALPQTLAESGVPEVLTPVEASEQPCLEPATGLFDRPSPVCFWNVEPGKAEGQPGKAEGQPGKGEGQPGKGEGQPRKLEGQPGKGEGQPRRTEGQPRKAEGQPKTVEGQPRKLEGQPRRLEGQPGKAEVQPLADKTTEPNSVAAAATSTPEILSAEATPLSVVKRPRSKRLRSLGGASWRDAVKAESDGGRGVRQDLVGSASLQGDSAKVEAEDRGLVILTRRQKRKMEEEKSGQLAVVSGRSLAVCGSKEPVLAGGCLEHQMVGSCRGGAQQVVSVEDKPVVEVWDKLTPRLREKATYLDANHDSNVVRLKRIEHILRGLPTERRKRAGKVKRAVAVPGWNRKRDRGNTGAQSRKGGGKLCALAVVRRNVTVGSRSAGKRSRGEEEVDPKVRGKEPGLRSEPRVYETRARRAKFEKGSIADRVALGMRQRVKVEPQDDDIGTERDGGNGPLGVAGSQCGIKRDARVYETRSRKGGLKRLVGEGAGAGARYRVKCESGVSEGGSEEEGGKESVWRAGEGRAKRLAKSAEREAGESNWLLRFSGKLREEPMSASTQPTLRNGKRFRAEVVDLRGTEEPELKKWRALNAVCKTEVGAGGSYEQDQKRSVHAHPGPDGPLVLTTSVDDALVQSDVPASATCPGELPPHKPVLPPEDPLTPAAPGDLLRLPRGGQGDASGPLLSVLYGGPALVRPQSPAANIDLIVPHCTVPQLSEPSEDMQPPAAPLANASPPIIETPNTQSSNEPTEEKPPFTAPASAPPADVSPPTADVTVPSGDGTPAVPWPATPEKVRPVRPQPGDKKEATGVASEQGATRKGSPGEEQPGAPPSEEGTCTCSTCCCSEEETVFVTLLVGATCTFQLQKAIPSFVFFRSCGLAGSRPIYL
jgi:hypothetical protein